MVAYEELSQEQKDVLASHQLWCRGDKNGQKADLSGINFSGVDLSGAYLSQANLSGANLSGANLSRANLYGADFSRANLAEANFSGTDLSRVCCSKTNITKANLSGADLTKANLFRANLSGANLSGANLSGANLSGANLSGANLSGADLSGTCLDAGLLRAQRKFVRAVPAVGKHNGRIVYRTAQSKHIGDTRYEPGRTYVANALSFSSETECHPGIYAGSLEAIRELFPGVNIVKCYVRDGEWVITGTEGFVRCARIRVLEILKGGKGDG